MGGGINGWIDGKVLQILEACGVQLPGGNGQVLRQVAGSWDTMGNALTGAVSALDGRIAGVGPDQWSGDARDAFGRHWQEQRQVMTDLAANMHKAAQGLRSYADEIDGINEAIIDICVQIAEMEIAGAALSFFTGFLSDLVANAAVAAKVAEVAGLVEKFVAAAERVGELLGELFRLGEEGAAKLAQIVGKLARLTVSSLGKTAEAFATNFVADAGSEMANEALSGKPVDVGGAMSDGWKEAAGTAAFTGVAGFAGGALGRGGGIVGDVLRNEGKFGTAANGALGNVAGTMTNDLAHSDQKSAGDMAWDSGIAAATGAYGNSRIRQKLDGLTERGGFGGENLSPAGRVQDHAYEASTGTAFNGAVYAAGSGIESDLQTLEQHEQ
ncbi:WXG100 family type VII secretion target [Streptacidiphilus monticola]|jgi:WXG100 family type VII secretion target|uniref:WXG100 family type VII secretion target n=1 Tax=Streptacidiphilus monticola TaxID=2161674 RepID=A0ABW1G138_9ACTN